MNGLGPETISDRVATASPTQPLSYVVTCDSAVGCSGTNRNPGVTAPETLGAGREQPLCSEWNEGGRFRRESGPSRKRILVGPTDELDQLVTKLYRRWPALSPEVRTEVLGMLRGLLGGKE